MRRYRLVWLVGWHAQSSYGCTWTEVTLQYSSIILNLTICNGILLWMFCVAHVPSSIWYQKWENRKGLCLNYHSTGGSTSVLPVTSHRSVQKLDVWHRSNPRADSCLFTPLRRAVHGIMPRINFLKTTGTGDLGRGRRGGGGGGWGWGALLVLRKALFKALLVQSAKSLSSACFLYLIYRLYFTLHVV